MNARRISEAQLAAALRAHLPAHAQEGLHQRIHAAIGTTPQQRRLPSFVGALTDADRAARSHGLMIAAALLLALAMASAAAVGALRLLLERDSPDLAVPAPTIAPSQAPSASLVIRAWDPAAALADWPGPVRPEPAAGSPTLLPNEGTAVERRYSDARGDASPASSDVVDLVGLYLRLGCWGTPGSANPAACISFDVVDPPPARLVPQEGEPWIAYGIVVDDDGDGFPDRRFGVDNGPRDGVGTRMWWTDLATGTTEAHSDVGESGVMDVGFPGRGFESEPQGHVWVRHPGPEFRFYAWASAIEDGVIIATDYAPDSGWLVLRPCDPESGDGTVELCGDQ